MIKSIKDFNTAEVEDIAVMVKSITTSIDRTGTTYQKLAIRDMAGNEGTFLKFDELIGLDCPVILLCRIEALGACLKVAAWKPAEGIDVKNFLPKAHISQKGCWKRYSSIIKSLRPALRETVNSVIYPERKRWVYYPLDESGPYARLCGIAEASLKLASAAANTANIYELDKDLMEAGALLYYTGHIGILNEMFVKTVQASLTSPAAAAYAMLEQAAEAIRAKGGNGPAGEEGSGARKLYDQDIWMLENILLSSAGLAAPMTPEAAALAQLAETGRQMDALKEAMREAEGGAVVNLPTGPLEKVYKAAAQEPAGK